MKTLEDWINADPARRGASLCISPFIDEDGSAVSMAELDIYPENGTRINEKAAMDYGLDQLARDAIAKTRPLSFPPKPLPVALGGTRVGSHATKEHDGRRKHRRKEVAPADPSPVVRADDWDEGEG
jgi:hypothetical protein